MRSFTKNISEVAAGQIIIHRYSTFIPIYSSIHVRFNTYTIIEESSYAIIQVILSATKFFRIKCIILDTIQDIFNILSLPSMLFWIACKTKNKIPVIDGDSR